VGADPPSSDTTPPTVSLTAPADAMPSILKAVHYICKKKGGEGAVQEIADLILAARHQT
jgi:3-deoxy-D-manno-octulosonate 8-phosphate phosphatase KdsC-like HAD superfamily phosphatase